ncbi:MAG TPA: hypothetical protein VMS22_20390 [Candidatus Eisenbacteria bacterium]|nr:hypothetical protein [Candidatus Eisenbacteria bacterium]
MGPATLELVPYDPAWAAAFRVGAERIRAVLGAVALRVDPRELS